MAVGRDVLFPFQVSLQSKVLLQLRSLLTSLELIISQAKIVKQKSCYLWAKFLAYSLMKLDMHYISYTGCFFFVTISCYHLLVVFFSYAFLVRCNLDDRSCYTRNMLVIKSFVKFDYLLLLRLTCWEKFRIFKVWIIPSIQMR